MTNELLKINPCVKLHASIPGQSFLKFVSCMPNLLDMMEVSYAFTLRVKIKEKEGFQRHQEAKSYWTIKDDISCCTPF